ncbi:MarR family winged helix-turn-helix transcriptional regulator [Cohnella hashimotonis]|uniref:MarR family transcriptional regulator n=1 Tax=Cohnella hashimotonis TaxID=2826895 RepID=A0ABT6TSX1_9BACL|nr:MarR family transcriptional regulator [Cohnella hashimotonis]MDI4649954.1 MarR family transcriptional regulator [Cohnella hashimotonis]
MTDALPDEGFLQSCLFFTANRLGRAITRIAEEEFAPTGLTPMYGYAIRLVNGRPGITQKELAEKLSIAPSTLTRFVDKLETKQLVRRSVQGKTVLLYPMPKGQALEGEIRLASKRLKARYKEILGDVAADALSDGILTAGTRLEKGGSRR